MHIIVTVKQVPDPNTPPNLFQIGEGGRNVTVPAGIVPVMNGYDANALEEALKLKEQHGGSVTVFSVGDEAVKSTLQKAIAMGADTAVHILGPKGLDTDSAFTAELIASAVRRLPRFDLILCGRQASDTDSGQVLFYLAELLDIPAVSPAVKILSVSDRDVTADRISEAKTQRLSIELPALIGVSSEINKPRGAPLKGLMLAKRAVIPTWTAQDLECQIPGPSVTLRRIYAPSKDAMPDVELIQGEAPAIIGRRLADRLCESGVI